MQYDPALSLELIKLIEANEAGTIGITQLQPPGYAERDIQEHLKLLIDEELILGKVEWADNVVFDIFVTRLTLKGHQFLAIARDQTKWKKFISAAQAGLGFITQTGFKLALEEALKKFMS